ncbi:hypothetical protein EVAR_94356_1 [Eumeta japonica]|uniref:Uncharacterized protein n=1 Tax=Eumeta variegata TaxID=151549 RepID=A0A4C1TPV1_EUMVA|nr:hypothetical protein EVAR_94356_1 [Eumeta japonica]
MYVEILFLSVLEYIDFGVSALVTRAQIHSLAEYRREVAAFTLAYRPVSDSSGDPTPCSFLKGGSTLVTLLGLRVSLGDYDSLVVRMLVSFACAFTFLNEKQKDYGIVSIFLLSQLIFPESLLK